MRNKIISMIIIVMGLLLAAGPWYLFRVCGEPMTCYWTGRTELGIGALIVIIGIMNMAVTSIEVRLGLNIALIFTGILSALVPTLLVGVCKMSKMNCRVITAPSILVISILLTLLAISNAYYQFRLTNIRGNRYEA